MIEDGVHESSGLAERVDDARLLEVVIVGEARQQALRLALP